MNKTHNLINNLKSIDFTSEFIKKEFEITINDWKSYNLFKNTFWRSILSYSFHDNFVKYLKLGKTFKNSENGIYDFIISGYSFGNYDDDGLSFDPEHGIMYLNINKHEIFCYYKTSKGGCPTCGFISDSDDDNINDTILYMSNNIEDLVNNCMTEREINEIYDTILF